jgi:hypothetical protein
MLARVKIVVQDCKTLEFYERDGTWTSEVGRAHCFSSSVAALEFCREHRASREVQIVMRFESEEHDLGFPVTDGCEKELEQNGVRPRK